MPTRTGNAEWKGSLRDGNGTVGVETGAFSDLPYTFKSRFEEGAGTNPEELIAAAHAGCYSMAFSLGLEKAGFSPNSVETEAKVHLTPADGGGFRISRIDLVTNADVPGIEESAFQQTAQA